MYKLFIELQKKKLNVWLKINSVRREMRNEK